MARRKRGSLNAEARRRNLEQLARLGQELRRSRLQRQLTQAGLGRRIGLAQATISKIELGHGGSHTLDAWQTLVTALGRALTVSLSRDHEEQPDDAGHLAIQELVLRTGRAGGYSRRFELTTRPSNPARSSDAGLIDPDARRIVLVECVNTVTDFGAAVRASHRKQAELADFAVSRGGSFQIGVCWVVRDVARNRALLRRYPEIVESVFPGSSTGWLRALPTRDAPLPEGMGLVWCDARATRLFARRATR